MASGWIETPEGLLRSRMLDGVRGLEHGFTTRLTAPWDGAPASLPSLVGLPASRRFVLARQVHGATAWSVAGPPPGGEAADALVTHERGCVVAVRTADCVPALVVVLDGDAPVSAAAIHAGWRGLLAGVVEAALACLAAPRGARLLAGLGPCIGPCCFEVGPEVASAFEGRWGSGMLRPGRGDRSFADLPGAVARVLDAAGVEVDAGPPCTRCAPDRFHSHRAHGKDAGRSVAFIGLAP